jgi:adenylate kinase
VATTIHYYEAILACLAIVVWHFYDVIFDPDVYPLNPACVDGLVGERWHAEEHPLDVRPMNHLTIQPGGATFGAMATKSNGPALGVSKTNGGGGQRAAWLKGGAEACGALPASPAAARRLVLLGAPGVGKGTQADLLHQWCGACHLSTGDIFRAAKGLPSSEQTPAIAKAIGYMTRGELVPDETVVALVSERMRCLRCAGGFLLDGFPRTVAQAEALEQLLKTENMPLTAVIDYKLPLDEIVARLAGRRICAGCQGVFHVTEKLTSPETCPRCGGKLYQREDDRPEAIRVRMAAYHRSTEPLIEYYRRRGLLRAVAATGTPEQIFQRTLEELSSRQAAPSSAAF